MHQRLQQCGASQHVRAPLNTMPHVDSINPCYACPHPVDSLLPVALAAVAPGVLRPLAQADTPLTTWMAALSLVGPRSPLTDPELQATLFIPSDQVRCWVRPRPTLYAYSWARGDGQATSREAFPPIAFYLMLHLPYCKSCKSADVLTAPSISPSAPGPSHPAGLAGMAVSIRSL